MTKVKVKITIFAEISSDKIKDVEEMIEELTSDSLYNIPSTENVTVEDTEWVETTLLRTL